jgi:hypothetical protein
MSFYRVCFENEAPRIGSGWRVVFLEHDGPKWVRLRCAVTGAPVSLSKTVWRALAATATPAYPRAGVLRAALASRARSLGHKLGRPEKAMIAAAGQGTGARGQASGRGARP